MTLGSIVRMVSPPVGVELMEIGGARLLGLCAAGGMAVAFAML